ncbi:MAG: hypothetical protein IJ088_16885 [Clostridia bacterium]|nr:hypothetical protein [Clostridia bacterium]
MEKSVISVSMALLWGVLFTNVLHSLPLGICMGLVWGFLLFPVKDDKNRP